MIKFFKKPTLTWTWTAVVIFISLGLVGFTNSISNAAPETGISTPKQTTQSSPSSSVADGSFEKPLVASEESIAAQANKITSNVWNLDIKSIEFTVGAEDQKFANVEFSMTNTSSLDKAFTPSGKIVSLVGTSGQTYESPMHHSLAKGYTESKSDRIKMDPQYKPGKFKFGIGLMVDNSEENFTKVIYQDESGKNFEIPIQGISPKIKPLPTNGK